MNTRRLPSWFVQNIRIGAGSVKVGALRPVGADPLWEALLSMHVLQTDTASAVFGPWRGAIRSRLAAPARELLRLAPPRGYSPASSPRLAGRRPGGGDRGAAVHPARTAPTRSGRTRGGGTAVTFLGPAAGRGDRDAVARLHTNRTDPCRNTIRTRLNAEHALPERFLTGSRLFDLLSRLHSCLSWQPPVPEVSGPGRPARRPGPARPAVVLLLASPSLLKDPALPVVVVYPMAHGTAVGRPSRPHPSLGALVGQTRTEVLESLAAHHAMTTTELAHGVGVAPATASHHAGVLREAGLLDVKGGPSGPAHADPAGPGVTGRPATPAPSFRPRSKGFPSPAGQLGA